MILLCRGRVLLLRRAKQGLFWPDYWCPPGGGCEAGETFLQAACRELEEETGIQNICLKEVDRQHLTVQNSPEMTARPDPPALLRSQIGDPLEFVSFVGEALVEPEVILDPEEHEDYTWATLADLGKLKVLPWDESVVRKLLVPAQI